LRQSNGDFWYFSPEAEDGHATPEQKETVIVIAVTDIEYDKAQKVFEREVPEGMTCLRAPNEEAALAAFIAEQNANHAIVGLEPYRGPLYEALGSGSVLARFGIGHDGIDKDAATAAGVLCTNTPGVLDDSVAEHTIALMLAAARHVPEVAPAMKRGEWAPKLGAELRCKTLAIIGCGRIGCRVAQIAAFGLGMYVVGCDPIPKDAAEMQTRYGVSRVTTEFDEAVADADFISLHLTATPETRHFINAGRLAAAPAKAWLINTARGLVADEAAIYDALASGRLAGAALDVFEQEPYTPLVEGKDLRTLDNALLTPHVGSTTQEASSSIGRRALQNIAAFEAGEFAKMDVLNPAALGAEKEPWIRY
jgi:phosphoglycerate dehydrogenase-like enzyme